MLETECSITVAKTIWCDFQILLRHMSMVYQRSIIDQTPLEPRLLQSYRPRTEAYVPCDVFTKGIHSANVKQGKPIWHAPFTGHESQRWHKIEEIWKKCMQNQIRFHVREQVIRIDRSWNKANGCTLRKSNDAWYFCLSALEHTLVVSWRMWMMIVWPLDTQVTRLHIPKVQIFNPRMNRRWLRYIHTFIEYHQMSIPPRWRDWSPRFVMNSCLSPFTSRLANRPNGLSGSWHAFPKKTFVKSTWEITSTLYSTSQKPVEGQLTSTNVRPSMSGNADNHIHVHD